MSAPSLSTVSDAEVAAWNAQPLSAWTWQELRARLLTEAYERELDIFLSAHAKASAIATIEERQIGGAGIRDLYHQVRNLKGPALRSATVWLSGYPRAALAFRKPRCARVFDLNHVSSREIYIDLKSIFMFTVLLLFQLPFKMDL
jgi:hypothetical protein